MIYELYNTETEQVEDTRAMPEDEAKSKNKELIEKGEPQRWVQQKPFSLNDYPISYDRYYF